MADSNIKDAAKQELLSRIAKFESEYADLFKKESKKALAKQQINTPISSAIETVSGSEITPPADTAQEQDMKYMPTKKLSKKAGDNMSENNKPAMKKSWPPSEFEQVTQGRMKVNEMAEPTPVPKDIPATGSGGTIKAGLQKAKVDSKARAQGPYSQAEVKQIIRQDRKPPQASGGPAGTIMSNGAQTKPSHEKGVHPAVTRSLYGNPKTENVSPAGLSARIAGKNPEHREAYTADAVKRHKSVFQQLQNMKAPNLPKSEDKDKDLVTLGDSKPAQTFKIPPPPAGYKVPAGPKRGVLNLDDVKKAKVDEGKSDYRKRQDRDDRANGDPAFNIMGVHQKSPYEGPGTSRAGNYLKHGLKGHAANAHDHVLAEQKAMPKPNLPKSEGMEKAKVDEGMSMEGKMRARAVRNDHPHDSDPDAPHGGIKHGVPKLQQGVHKPVHPHLGESGQSQAGHDNKFGNNVLAREGHRSVFKQLQAMKTPNLPKSEDMTKAEDSGMEWKQYSDRNHAAKHSDSGNRYSVIHEMAPKNGPQKFKLSVSKQAKFGSMDAPESKELSTHGSLDEAKSAAHSHATGVKKSESALDLAKGVMADIAHRESKQMGAPSAAPKAQAKMPSPQQNAGRANAFSAASAGAFQPKGPINSGLELASKPNPMAAKTGLKSPGAAGVAPVKAKPGIFGKLFGKAELEKGSGTMYTDDGKKIPGALKGDKTFHQKGVHKPYGTNPAGDWSPGPGVSDAGSHVHAAHQNEAWKSPAHIKQAKQRHAQVQAEAKNIKPNLPKAEIEKARVDEGQSREAKVAARSERHPRLGGSKVIGRPDLVEQHGVHDPKHTGMQGKSHSAVGYNVMNAGANISPKENIASAKKTHAKVQSDASKVRPNLPKSEDMKKGIATTAKGPAIAKKELCAKCSKTPCAC